MPPCCASAIAKCDSVTVSMAAETIGMLREISRVRQVRVSTSAGTTSLWAGSRRTSSKVRPSGSMSWIIDSFHDSVERTNRGLPPLHPWSGLSGCHAGVLAGVLAGIAGGVPSGSARPTCHSNLVHYGFELLQEISVLWHKFAKYVVAGLSLATVSATLITSPSVAGISISSRCGPSSTAPANG